MLYLYPYISFATVDLNHYNLWADKMRADGYPVKNQKSAFGTGLGLGYKANLLDVGVSFAILYSSSTSGWNPINGVYSERTHSLLNFLMNVPVGLNYPLSDQFSVLVAFKPIFGYSRLRLYDSTDSRIITRIWQVSDASLSSTSFGLGFEMGGDFSFSRSVSLALRFGYDAINFKRYEGEEEERYSDGTYRKKVAFFVFDLDNNEIKVKNQYPDPSKKEIWGEENISGFRFSLGLKIGIGR
jgi:hypothetical protein